MKNERRLRIMTAEGELRGTMDEDLFVFKGIPYAAPPVGSLRWRPPQAIEPWASVRDATTFGPASWQDRAYCLAVGGGDPGEFSEDCLYLNIWTPDIDPSVPLPVMVWLHGGGFKMGSGGLPPYHGKPLAARGAVVVTLNYRLGHLGFFAHSSLDKEYDAGSVINNFGLLDQIAALQWVQRNIPAFGGDRHNVTLMGESSGARSVLSLCCSPLAEGLFHKGIVQSAYSLPDKPRKEALLQGERVATHLGLPENASADALRALPADAFWSLDRSLGNGPVPVQGDAVLPESMLSVFLAARQHRVPLMVGSNSDEGSVLEYFGVDTAGIINQIRSKKKVMYRLIKWMYDIHDDTQLGRAVARDMAFTIMPWLVVRAQHNAGMPGWRYWFDYVSENARDIYPHGTWHGNEVPYVLNTLTSMQPADDRPYTANDHQFSDRVSHYWFTFARDANAFSHTLDAALPWPVWHPTDDLTLSLGEQGKNNMRLMRHFMKSRMRLFRLLMASMVHLH